MLKKLESFYSSILVLFGMVASRMTMKMQVLVRSKNFHYHFHFATFDYTEAPSTQSQHMPFSKYDSKADARKSIWCASF